jgi:hypothetical protein
MHRLVPLLGAMSLVYAADQDGAALCLTASERRTVAEFFTGKTIGAEHSTASIGLCADPKAPFSPGASDWSGWGSDVANSRYQPKPAIAGAMLYLDSGYGAWGGLPGNVMLAFSVDGK